MEASFTVIGAQGHKGGGHSVTTAPDWLMQTVNSPQRQSRRRREHPSPEPADSSGPGSDPPSERGGPWTG